MARQFIVEKRKKLGERELVVLQLDLDDEKKKLDKDIF